MDNQVRVRMGHRVEDVEKQMNARVDRQRMFDAVAIDARAVHILEYQVRLAGDRDSCINEMCDVWMRQLGEEITLATKALFAGAADEGDVEELDRSATFEASVAALGEPHAAHTPFPDRRDQAVRTEGLAF
jgi:hypothetical protein